MQEIEGNRDHQIMQLQSARSEQQNKVTDLSSINDDSVNLGEVSMTTNARELLGDTQAEQED